MLSGALWARFFGVSVAGLGAIANFLWVPYYPLWALTLVAVNLIAVWALCIAPPKIISAAAKTVVFDVGACHGRGWASAVVDRTASPAMSVSLGGRAIRSAELPERRAPSQPGTTALRRHFGVGADSGRTRNDPCQSWTPGRC
ncbi:DUF7144 family membrane protein [Streptomyces mirabilis]